MTTQYVLFAVGIMHGAGKAVKIVLSAQHQIASIKVIIQSDTAPIKGVLIICITSQCGLKRVIAARNR